MNKKQLNKNKCKDCNTSIGIGSLRCMSCYGKTIVGKNNPMFGRSGKLSPTFGRKHSQETKDKIRLSNTGKKRSLEVRKMIGEMSKNRKHSQESKLIMSAAAKNAWKDSNRKNKNLISIKKYWDKKGRITPVNKAIRSSLLFRLWREEVFKRDNYTCQECKARSGKGRVVCLEAHHIKSFSQYPKLRFNIDNGQTLCKDCHKLTDNYGRKALKINQLAFN